MSDECQATDPKLLRERIMDCRIAKSESEWWAAREIEKLESRLSVVETERDKMIEVIEGLKLTIVRDSQEIDRLKAELEIEQIMNNENSEKRNELFLDRDEWKAKAEKFREYLETIKKHEEIVGFDPNPLETVWKLAKEALDYDKGYK